MNIYWRKMNTVRTTYMSIQPSTAWKITRGLGATWNVYYAAKDGDEYQHMACVSTLAKAKQYASEWRPE